MERRNFTVTELRAFDGDMPPTISGYAAVFNSQSEDLGGFIETIAPGAFAETLDGDVRALWNHDSKFVLGRTTNGTLKLAEDERGLRFEVQPPETSYAADVMALVRRGDVNQMSFGFEVVDDEWRTEAGINYRTLKKVRLFEVSPVTFPAYAETSAEARAMCEQLTAAASRATDGADDESPDGHRANIRMLKNKLKLVRVK